MKIVLSLVILGLAFFWTASSQSRKAASVVLDSDATVVRGKELEHLFESMEAVDTTFTVQCCNTGRFSTCGAGESCKKVCGDTITYAKVVSQDRSRPKPSGDYCTSRTARSGGPGIIIFIPCFSFINTFCKIYVTNDGETCSGLHENFETQHGSVSFDFCCYCNAVFSNCKCDCCKCRQVGGACNGDCNTFPCPYG